MPHKLNYGRFPSDKTFWNSGNFQSRMKQHFAEFSRKEDNLARYTRIFVNFLPGIFVPFDFPPRISVEWFAFQKLNNSRIFRKLPKEIFVPFVSLSKVAEFWFECKALY